MALGMRKLGLAGEIVGVGRGAENLSDAQQLGIIDRWTHQIAEGVVGADLVVLGTPVRAMPDLVAQCQGKFKPGAILTDVGSTKARVINDILPLVTDRIDFVPTHPIAGKEKSGAKYSDPEIFSGRWTIIVPTRKASDLSIMQMRDLWQALGAKVEVMPAEVHDDILAAISHLPHMVAYALVSTLLELDRKNRMLQFSAGGFRDYIRIAGSSPEMWRDICLENKRAILESISQYEAHLSQLRKMIAEEKSEDLLQYFADCRDVKERVEKG